MLTVEEIQQSYADYNYRKRGNRIFVDQVLGHDNNGGTVYSWYKKKSPERRMISVYSQRYVIRSRNFADVTNGRFPKI